VFKPSVQARATVRNKPKGSSRLTSLKTALVADFTMLSAATQAALKEA